jgi:hypothetical protein
LDNLPDLHTMRTMPLSQLTAPMLPARSADLDRQPPLVPMSFETGSLYPGYRNQILPSNRCSIFSIIACVVLPARNST